MPTLEHRLFGCQDVSRPPSELLEGPNDDSFEATLPPSRLVRSQLR